MQYSHCFTSSAVGQKYVRGQKRFPFGFRMDTFKRKIQGLEDQTIFCFNFFSFAVQITYN